MSETLVFVAPMPPHMTNRPNLSRHWRTVHNEKKAYWRMLDMLALAKQLPPVPAEPWEQATVRSSMLLGGAMDDDNAIARHKSLLDWIVRAGYIRSDRRTCLRWEGLPDQRVSRKEPATITLTLTRVTPTTSES